MLDVGWIRAVVEKNGLKDSLIVFVFYLVSWTIHFFYLSLQKSKMKPKDFTRYKIVKEEYAQDKNNGYFLFQSYLKLRVPAELVDFILTSPEAYTLMKNLKRVYSYYSFDGQKFTMKKPKFMAILKILAFIIYFFSSFTFLFYLFSFHEIIAHIGVFLFFWFLFVLGGVLVPFSILSIHYIIVFRDLNELVKLTAENEEKKTVSNLHRKIPLKCKSGLRGMRKRICKREL